MKKLFLILSFAFLGLTAQAQIQYIEEKPQYIEKQADSLRKSTPRSWDLRLSKICFLNRMLQII